MDDKEKPADDSQDAMDKRHAERHGKLDEILALVMGEKYAPATLLAEALIAEAKADEDPEAHGRACGLLGAALYQRREHGKAVAAWAEAIMMSTLCGDTRTTVASIKQIQIAGQQVFEGQPRMFNCPEMAINPTPTPTLVNGDGEKNAEVVN